MSDSEVKYLTPIEQMHSLVDSMQKENINISIDNTHPNRAAFPTCKLDLTMEFVVFKNGPICIGLSRAKGASAKLSKETYTNLIELIESKGYMVFVAQKTTARWKSTDLIADIKAIHKIVEETEFVPNGGSSWRRTNYNLRLNTVARQMQINAENNDTTAFSRDIIDTLNTRVSVNTYTSTLSHGEHAVPVDFLYKASIDMFNAGKTVEDVVDFLERNLKVVYIRPKDATRLDGELKLKTGMPAGWVDGNSPFARLDVASITVENPNSAFNKEQYYYC
jgi:hypothetical protein